MQSKRRPKKLGEEELFSYAVKLLGVRGYSSGEMRTKLRAKAAEAGDCDKVIDRLKDIRYLDDEQFAQSYATARRDNEGFGKFRVLMDLKKRRVGGELANEAVGQAYAEVDEADLVSQYIERRMPSIAAGGVEDEKKLATAYRRLRRAGFSPKHIFPALKKFAARPEALEEPTEDDVLEDLD